MHEIITLQFGQQANYLGTHYWNTQESYFTYDTQEETPVDHDRSFRPGVGADGADTYTPRALIYDLKGAFGTLRRENELYQLQNQPDPVQQNAWGRDAFTIRLPPVSESPYQQALNAGTSLPQLTSETVRFWSDYNHVYFHPRSLVQLNEYELNSSLMPFEHHETGEDLFNNLDREYDILDRDLRPFLEECDQLQGIQVLSSSTDAWGGFTSRYIERIADELGKGAYWLFTLEDNSPAPRQTALTRLADIARTMASTSENLSLHVPLQSVPGATPAYLHLDTKSLWHTSALQATIVETITLPARLKLDNVQHATFHEIEAVLNTDNHRPLAAASISFTQASQRTSQPGTYDHRMMNGLSHEEVLDTDQPLDIDMFPSTSASLTGTSRASPSSARLFARYAATRDVEDDDADPDDTQTTRLDTRTLGRRISILLPMLKSFPQIVDVGSAEKIACQAAVTSSERVSNRVRYMAHLTRAVLPVDEREALYDTLSTLAEEYEESMGFSDASDDDD
ncbi:hypothetical protein AMS68_001890 [Peltaster fructicola]|uniref:Tubulin nucleotide-binding domain-like protein n=1 Tax=Peltaster fructicola TaxID=286661 RepID=A0A6H0XNS6_9PEZI|nr:hypothetical protein AMS68_001890 [Peltaster fructicola]